MTFNAGIEAAKQLLIDNGFRRSSLFDDLCALTRPLSSAPVEQREAVAWRWRFVDQKSWTLSTNHPKHADDYDVLCEPLYTDAILSLPGSSRDEVLEQCAQIAADCESTAEDREADANIQWHEGHDHACFEIAKAIRALKSGVAK